MKRKDDNSSAEELVQNFLKKNKNFFIKHPELLKELQFPLKDEGSDKVIDLQVYRYKKINQENIDLQNQMTQILLAGKSHIQSQKRILKSSLKILNSKSLAKVFSVIFFLCALMMALDPLGLVLGFLMLLFTMWRGGYINGRTMNGVSILYLLVVSVAVIFEFFSNVTKGESQLARISINYGFLLRNYLMLWVSLLASIVIMFAYPGLRSQLIPSVIRWYQLLLFYFLVSIPAIVLYSQDSGFSSVLLIHTLLPLGILSTFPLILWSRFVMPKIRSIWVWCLLPVLVYVSFWLILWPIDLEGFPYDLLV